MDSGRHRQPLHPPAILPASHNAPPPRRPPRHAVNHDSSSGVSPSSPTPSLGSSSSEGPDLRSGSSGGGGSERDHRGGAQAGGGAGSEAGGPDYSMPQLLNGEKVVGQYPEMNYVCPYTVPNSVKGTLTVTNYRLFFYGAHREGGPTLVDVPLGCVSRIEKVGRQRTTMANELAYGLDIVCKDIRSLRFAFNKMDNKRKDIFETLHLHTFPLSHNSLLFAFQYQDKHKGDGWNVYDPVEELKRQGLPNDSWTISRINERYEICETYPRIFGIPSSTSKEMVAEVAKFRSRGRLPVLSWIHPASLATICRCAQPLVGMTSNKSSEDQEYIRAIMEANAHTDRIFIMDARPKINSMVNRVNGGGSENEDIYQSAELCFLDIQNIHVMRESLRKLRDICFPVIDDNRWLSNVDNTNWLHHLHCILAGAVKVADKVENAKSSVIVHCSDGWDRTAQITSMAMMLMDPYYRTLRGFQVLVEKEWLSFGHKFAHRIGHGVDKPNDNDRSPVFLQFIDCVWQVLNQFPNSFEFNEHFLTCVMDHLYSCRFGTFLYNSDKERRSNGLQKHTQSLWSFINADIGAYLNPTYNDQVDGRSIMPETSERYLKLWTSYYCRHNPRMRPQESTRLRGSQLLAIKSQLKTKLSHLKKETSRRTREESIPTNVGPPSSATVTRFESINI